MSNPNQQLSRLENALLARGMSEERVEEICRSASSEINDAVMGIVQQSMTEIEGLGAQAGADKFLDQVKLFTGGDKFRIGTSSGQLDFSEPPFPMLPRLLNNGKVAKDGSVYKTIPVHQDGKRDAQAMATSSMDAANRRQGEIDTARQAMRDKEPVSMASALAASMKPIGGKPQVWEKGSEVNFRTASSKQNPSKQWVKPARKMDMTDIVEEVNARMQNQIDDVIATILNRYGV